MKRKGEEIGERSFESDKKSIRHKYNEEGGAALSSILAKYHQKRRRGCPDFDKWARGFLGFDCR